MKLFRSIDRARSFTEDERIVLDQLQRIVDDVVAPNAAEYDRSCTFPGASVDALNALGMNAIFVPEEYGGAPMRYGVYLECVSIISEACASTGIIYGTNYHAMGPVIDHATESQKARLLPRIAAGGLASLAITEPSAGSDALRMQTRFTPDGDEIIIDGGKTFITSGDVADLVLLFGKWAGIDAPRQAISAVVLEKGVPGFEILRKEDKMGHRASTTATLSFSGCRIPRDNMIGEPGSGLQLLLTSLNKSRPSIAAHARGIARAAFKDMIAYMNEREQSGRKIIEFQGNQFLIADLASDLALLETWIDHVARLVEDNRDDIAIEASIAKMKASDLAMRMTTEAVQMHGGYGYCMDYRVERLMRDAKITQIWEGTNQIHRQLIGRSFRNR